MSQTAEEFVREQYYAGRPVQQPFYIKDGGRIRHLSNGRTGLSHKALCGESLYLQSNSATDRTNRMCPTCRAIYIAPAAPETPPAAGESLK